MLEQKTVDTNCDAALARYNAMSMRDANLTFSYEMQGFIACLVETHKIPLGDAITKVLALIGLVTEANKDV